MNKKEFIKFDIFEKQRRIDNIKSKIIDLEKIKKQYEEEIKELRKEV